MEKKISPADQEFLDVLAKNLIRLRKKMDVSQEVLAAQAGFHRTYLSHVELGRRNVSVLSLLKLASALNVQPYQLLKPPPVPGKGASEAASE